MNHPPPSNAPATYPPMTRALAVWGTGALFYLLGFFHRVAPAVLTEDLMLDFSISAAALGHLSAFYFYSYVLMQIPTGILADRLGPRKLLSCGALLAALGAAIFSLAPSFAWAATGRLLIGASVAVAFVCLLKLAASWFSSNRFALVSGLALFCGIIGAVFAGPPLQGLSRLFGWRAVMLTTAVITLLAAGAIWIFVRDTPGEKGYADYLALERRHRPPGIAAIFQDLLEVFCYRNTALLLFIPGGIVGSVLTFSGLWGVPFLSAVHGMSAGQASAIASATLVAWAVAGPFFGWLSDRLGNRKGLYLIGCGISLLGWTCITCIPSLPPALLIAILLTTGFSSGCMIISFAFIKESVPIHLAGTVSGVINMGVMSGPMLLQPAVGLIMDRMWAGELAGGVRVFSAAAYRTGFSLMAGWMALSFLLLFFTRDTGCRQLET